MKSSIRLFLLVEGLSLMLAALIHSGVLIPGYAHQQAGTAESVIGVVLLASLIWTLARPEATRPIGLGAQAFGLLGTGIGIFTIAIGVGPRTTPDIAYHIVLVCLLAWGLAVAARTPARGRS